MTPRASPPFDWRASVKKLPVAGALLESVWRGLTGRRNLTFTLLNSRRLSPAACIVKIGANDGSIGDPISQLLARRPGMRCVFVEPVPHLLDRARKNWGDDPRFSYINAAINEGRLAVFYYVDAAAHDELKDLEIDPDQLGSFDRGHILKHPGGERLAPYIRTLDVQGLSLDALFAQANVTALDVLHVDTEGWDWKILSQLDLNRWTPVFILFEHIHLSPADQAEARARLSPSYDIEPWGTDWLCTRKASVKTSPAA